VLREGDVVDGLLLGANSWDVVMNDVGDGIPEANRPLSGWPGPRGRLAVGSRRGDGSVPVHFTAELFDPTTPDFDTAFSCAASSPAECFLVLGEGTGGTSFETWFHTLAPQLDVVTRSWVVTLSDGPVIALLPARAPSAPRRFDAQVLMWNPWVFPAQPAQWSNDLSVTILPDGRWRAAPYGSSTGMQLRAEEVTNAAGERVLRLPFSIPGM
jgi:hypothetical protein